MGFCTCCRWNTGTKFLLKTRFVVLNHYVCLLTVFGINLSFRDKDVLICFEMVFFAIAHRYAFPYTDYMHYSLQQQHSKSRTPSSSARSNLRSDAHSDTDALFLFDQDHNVVNNPEQRIDVEYEPPTVRQLDVPMSVSRALLGTVNPNETLSDIARMSMGGRVVVGEGSGRGDDDRTMGSRTGSGGRGTNDVVFSMDQAEGI